MKLLSLFTASMFCLIYCCSFCQQKLTTNQTWESVKNIEQADQTNAQKLSALYLLKKNAEKYNLTNDSAYSLVLAKIGKYEYYNNLNLSKAINYTQIALKINNLYKTKASQLINVMCYFNLGFYNESLMLSKNALSYYDSSIKLCNNFNDSNQYEINCRCNKAVTYFFLGDYQKSIEESVLGISIAVQKKDTANFIYLLNRKAQSLYFEGKLKEASREAKVSLAFAKAINYYFEEATSCKTLGFIFEELKNFDSANYYYNQSIKIRLTTNEYEQIASDYNDLANFYLNSLKNYSLALKNYYLMLSYSNKIKNSQDNLLKKAMAYNNLGENFFLLHNYDKAEKYFVQSFFSLNINLQNSLLKSVQSRDLSKVSNKDLVIVLMSNKTKWLLNKFKETQQHQYLIASINNAVIEDSVITQIRHEQSGEQSKLYWRDKTRDFYVIALEACYLNNNPKLAFFFMEKSRAVLLNDKLNELGASAYLSPADAIEQERYQIKIVELEQKLNAISEGTKEFTNTQLNLLNVKNNLEQYIKLLEIKYPAYYQYKYADKVPSLENLQSFLKKDNQCFVDYFIGDSLMYILAISSNSAKLIQLTKQDFNKDQLSLFLQLCTNKEVLNNHYDSFAELSNSIYKKIFQPLQLPKGRIIICADNILIPFDALCTDEKGKSFLLSDYSFSYVYSARFLMKQFNNPAPTGNFLGFAPVSFASYLDVQDLKNAANAVYASASYYPNSKLFINSNASRRNFFNNVSSYSVVGIFSHARADTTDNEPILYMQDSVIHLSELQLLNKPATKLVLLSACQTNVGKVATGEGIYSLARGFATAGITSVAATLWKADEQTIYSISEKFNEYLSEGMTKDEALQKAKLYFIQNNSNSENMLPYYWANMILIGNADAIKLTTTHSNFGWWIAGSLLIIIAFIFFYWKRSNYK